MRDNLEEIGWKGTVKHEGGQKVYERIQAWDRKVKVAPTLIQPPMRFIAGGKLANIEKSPTRKRKNSKLVGHNINRMLT